MNYEEIVVPSRDLYSLAVRIYDVKNPKVVIKCIHGMEEHQDRYVEFATFLQNNGYAVVTADLRGHGKSAPKLSHIADRDGDKLLIEDELVIKEYIKEKYKGVPMILFGHSMGTIIARKVLQTESKEYVKVVLSGYPNPQAAAAVGAFLSKILRGRKRGDKHSKTLTNLVIGPFTKAVKDRKTDLDWLSYNEENVQRYIDDPLCGVEFTIGSYNALFNLLADINKPKLYKDVKEDLPFYLISGDADPCTGGEKGRNDSIDRLSKAGFKNLEVYTMPNMRHEILNEDKKDEVMERILTFLNK